MTGGAGIEGGPAIVSARPRGRAPRRPVCGRRCEGWNRLATRRWRATDLGASRCHPGYAPLRAGRPEHGEGAEAVPWARSAASRFAPASGGADVSAARGHGRAQADALPGLPAEGQGKGIEVAGGGARRAADVVAERLPDAELAVDPTRVAGWAAGAPGGPGGTRGARRGAGPPPGAAAGAPGGARGRRPTAPSC